MRLFCEKNSWLNAEREKGLVVGWLVLSLSIFFDLAASIKNDWERENSDCLSEPD